MVLFVFHLFIFSLAPAPESITNKIFQLSKEIKSYQICSDITVDLTRIGKQEWSIHNGKKFTVEVVDCVQDYSDLMKEVFDFEKLRKFLTVENAPKILLNAMHGGKFSELICSVFLWINWKDFMKNHDDFIVVTGPYIKRIFVDELCAPETSIINYIPKEDFGGTVQWTLMWIKYSRSFEKL